MFDSIYTYDAAGVLNTDTALIAVAVSFVLGLIISLAHRFRSEASRSLSVSLIALPVIVQLVILMVNGNAGTGIAVLGAFSLIRFRSVPGSARDIVFIFLSMAVGIATGVGMIWAGIAVTLLVCAVMVVLSLTGYGNQGTAERDLRITIPEDLDYTCIFDDLFEKYTTSSELINVKLKNLGTMFHLTYSISLKKEANEKEFIDEIRVRNANLDIICSKVVSTSNEL